MKLFYVWCCLVVASVGLCATEQAVYYHSKYLRATLLLQHYEGRVASLEDREELVIKRLEKLTEIHSELQAWREHITTASRMGWPAANRYIQDYPLQFEYAKRDVQRGTYVFHSLEGMR